MDREDAISVIENEIQIDVRLCTDDQVDRFQTALYMAISALRADHTGDDADMMTNAHIDQEAWTAEWIKRDGYTECSKCEHWYDSPVSEDEGDRPAFCPGCGRAMTPEARAELEKRVRGVNW